MARRLRRSPSGSPTEFDDEPLTPSEWQQEVENEPAAPVLLADGVITPIFDANFPNGPIPLPPLAASPFGVEVEASLTLQFGSNLPLATSVDLEIFAVRAPDQEVPVVQYRFEGTGDIPLGSYPIKFSGEVRDQTTANAGDLVGVFVRGINNGGDDDVIVVPDTLSLIMRRIQ